MTNAAFLPPSTTRTGNRVSLVTTTTTKTSTSSWKEIPFRLTNNNNNNNNKNSQLYAALRVTYSPPVPQDNSFISKITAYNLAGIVNDTDNNKEICIQLSADDDDTTTQSSRLVAVSGETGSGKSLLMAKVANLVTGGKATASLIPKSSSSSQTKDYGVENRVRVEMEIKLGKVHRDAVQKMVEPFRIHLGDDGILRLKRTLIFIGRGQSDDDNNTKDDTNKKKNKSTTTTTTTATSIRLKSACEINDTPVTLKTLRMIASPLITIVDASTASMVLSKPEARMAILDTSISPILLQKVKRAQIHYKKCRVHREELEQSLANRIVPPTIARRRRSHSNNNNNYHYDDDDEQQQQELLKHWVEELDVFEQRMNEFCQSLTLFPDSDGDCEMASCIKALSKSSWKEDDNNKKDDTTSSSSSSMLYSNLLDFREAMKTLETQYERACMAAEVLSSLSNPNSALTAVEKARSMIYDVASESNKNNNKKDALASCAEKTHERLNQVEEALRACSMSLEDNDGLISVLENRREYLLPCSLEELDSMISEWNTLSRKHGMTSSSSPYTLPSCHASLKEELEGTVQAQLLLPNAMTKEQHALREFENACQDLSSARISMAKAFSDAISVQRMPSLSMTGMTFEVVVHTMARKCTDESAYNNNAATTTSPVVGTDSIDFLLHHGGGGGSNKNKNHGGKLEEVASSGEKARLLLAMECELPGSIGASCGRRNSNKRSSTSTDDDDDDDDNDNALLVGQQGITTTPILPPVAVVYDEIDSHVGGRAAVAMAKMLADQAKTKISTSSSSTNNGGAGPAHQVICITHTPSVAAVADRHLVIQKVPSSSNDGTLHHHIKASMVDGMDRRKELARMASGDLAPEEAQAFAEALLRNGVQKPDKKEEDE